MTPKGFIDHLDSELAQLKDQGLFKTERRITSPQSGQIDLADTNRVINLCANNYLGLADHPALIEHARQTLLDRGYGMASVRFICGTQDVHKDLETALSDFLGMEDTILYSSCFDANAGLFETILGPEDAIISDALNHASIIDGVRLCKAKRLRYANSDMVALENCLQQAQSSRFRLIATDGVFSMDGYIAKLDQICDLAEKYDAMVMVDDSHAIGFVGANGKGSIEHCDVMGRVDLVTGTLGKALGGASGGYTSGSANLVQWLRQRSRPYLFSNSLAPVIAKTSLVALDLIQKSGELRAKLYDNANHFRKRMGQAGFDLLPGEHPIIPVMLRDPQLAQDMAKELGQNGVFVAPFSFPVVPKGQDRIRTQMSAAHDRQTLDQAVDAFVKVGKSMGVIQ